MLNRSCLCLIYNSHFLRRSLRPSYLALTVFSSCCSSYCSSTDSSSSESCWQFCRIASSSLLSFSNYLSMLRLLARGINAVRSLASCFKHSLEPSGSLLRTKPIIWSWICLARLLNSFFCAGVSALSAIGRTISNSEAGS